jgi:hypothetical protein
MAENDRHRAPESVRDVLSIFLRETGTLDERSEADLADMHWRLREQRISDNEDQIRRAIEWLVGNDYLKWEEAGGIRYYRLNPEKRDDARRLVQGEAHEVLPPRPPTPVEGPLMVAAVDWIDAALLHFLASHREAVGDYPLTRTHESIERLLAGRRRGTPREVDTTATALKAALEAAGAEQPLAALWRRLGLTDLELHVLLLVLAPEIDGVYQLAYGVLNDDMSRRTPSLALVCQLVGSPGSVRDQLSDSAALTRWRLLDQGETWPHADEPLHVDPAVVNWLLGDDDALESDTRLRPVLRRRRWPGATWLTRGRDVEQIGELAIELRPHHHRRHWVVLHGDDLGGSRAMLEAAARRAQVRLLRILLPPFAASAEHAYDVARRVARACALLNALPAVDTSESQFENGDADALALLLTVFSDIGHAGTLIAPDLERVVGALPPGRGYVNRRPASDVDTLAAAYVAAALETHLHLDWDDAERIAHVFPLPFEAIDEAVRLAILEGAAEQPASEHADLLASACRRVASPDIPRYAKRVEPVFDLNDLVLPPDRRVQLDEIVAHVKYAAQVLHTWGFGDKLPYGRAVAALFSGPSGTGKSMAVQAIAKALNTITFVLDLSKVVSRYLGDCEKALDIAFRDAQRAGAVLQIDEAEALFGKRSEVKDSHDRYANVEVAYLLQRMESFEGVAVLTTNLKENLDQAFLRRLRFVVEFPKPDAAAREAIWRRCLPATAPFHDINIRFLARRLEVTGGNIKQITIRAAFLAAAERSATIEMKHIVAATRAELLKLGMAVAARELAELDAAQRAAVA